MNQHRYTAEFIDRDDRHPYWCVVEWNTAGDQAFRSGNLIEQHADQLSAESAARIYNTIYAFAN